MMNSAIAFFVLFASQADAFSIKPFGARKCTKLFIDDTIAELIDGALYRQQHHKDVEKKWEEQNKKMLENEFMHELEHFEEESIGISPRQRRKDLELAQTNPEAYCKDRCVAVGECEVFEDLYVKKNYAPVYLYTWRSFVHSSLY